MAKLKLVSSTADSPGAVGSPKKTITSKPRKKSKQNKRFYAEWEQPFQLKLDNNLREAVPLWLARVHTDFATFGGLPVIDGNSLWFNAWSVANLLEWTDIRKFGELEPQRLRRLAVAAMELRLSKTRSAEKTTELSRKIRELASTRIGRYAKESYIPRSEIVKKQIEQDLY